MSDKQTAGLGALGTLLARNLDDIPDLPVFKCPPPGTYTYLIESCNQKEINKKTAVVVEYVITNTIELSDPEGTQAEDLVAPGDKFSEAFWFDDAERVETTISVLKLKFGGLGGAVGETQLDKIMEKMVGMEVKGIIGNRVDKNDKSKLYPQTRDMVPAGQVDAKAA